MAIPYKIPFENKRRRYFPDFMITARQKDGSVKRFMIEVKPAAQTKPPKVQKTKTKKYLTEVSRWATNSSKWQAARKFCQDNDIVFKIVTEKDLHFFGSKK